MFHLFNRVYLTFDFMIQPGTKGIVLSDVWSEYPYNTDIARSLVGVAPTYIAYVKNECNGSDKKFFDYLITTDEPLIVYCDLESYMTVFLKHIKALLPNANTDILYTVYKYTILKSKFIESQQEPSSKKMKQGLSALPIMPFSEFSGLVSDVIGIDPYGDFVKNNTSVEWLLSTYLANNNTVLKKEIENRVWKICWKSVAWEMEELKTNLLGGIRDIHTVFPELPALTEITQETLTAIVKDNEDLVFLADPGCTPDNIDVVKNYGALFFKGVLNKYQSALGQSDTFLDALLDTMASETSTAKTLLDLDITQKFGTQLFARSEYANKMNPLLISYFYKLYREEALDKLSMYSLGV